MRQVNRRTFLAWSTLLATGSVAAPLVANLRPPTPPAPRIDWNTSTIGWSTSNVYTIAHSLEDGWKMYRISFRPGRGNDLEIAIRDWPI